METKTYLLYSNLNLQSFTCSEISSGTIHVKEVRECLHKILENKKIKSNIFKGMWN